MNESENWALLDDFDIAPFCEVSDAGNFRYNINGKAENVEPYISTNGYLYHFVVFNDYMSKQLVRADMLVALRFLPIPEELIESELEIIHLDGDLTNNHINNLKWVRDIEIWRPIKLNPIIENRYFVSSWGRVIDADGNFMHSTMRCGYRNVYLKTHCDASKIFQIHRLIGYEFLNLTDDLDINHINGVISNNHLDNLEVVTRAQNNQHARYADLNKCSLNPLTFRLIKDALIEVDWYPTKALKLLHENGLTFIKITMIYYVKKCLSKDDKNECKVRHKKKLYEELSVLIKELLIKHNGNRDLVVDDLIDLGYTNITVYNVNTIREKMKEYNFPNRRLNRKISESQREQLKQILKENEMSPSKAIIEVHKKGFDNVTIYDMKHLKHRMIKYGEA